MDLNKEKLTNFYNKFNEDKRLDRRHGQIEFLTILKYIYQHIKKEDKIIDIGAGTGKYSIYLKNNGYNIAAVEYVRPNIGKIRNKCPSLNVIEADARDLSIFNDKEFDVSLLFGPLYHLYSKEDKLKALSEAKRITKKLIFVSYILNEYCILKYAFIDDNYKDVKNKIDENYKIIDPDNIFYQVRIEEIDELNKELDLKLIKRFSPDGPSDYIRKTINKMDEETFKAYFDYHLKTCERKDLLGAGSHLTDILEI